VKTDKQKNQSEDQPLNQLNNYAKYTGLAFQMLGVIGIGTWFGFWLDGRMQNKVPIFTLLGAMLGLAAAIYWLLRISKTE
jgi:ATP synthase protein I